MKFEPEIAGCTIVLLGQFNPMIFHPSWFAQNGVVSEKAIKDSQLDFMAPEVTSLELEDIKMQIELQRFTATIISSPWVRLADLIAKTFGEILTHTPIEVGGINVHYHTRLESVDARTAWGRKLAPLAPWGPWGEQIEQAKGGQAHNGLRSITMLENWATKDFIGHWQIQLEPSTKIADHTGVYFAVNHEFRLAPGRQEAGGVWAAKYIHQNFDKVLTRMNGMLDDLYERRN